jgi:hypothetical protein
VDIVSMEKVIPEENNCSSFFTQQCAFSGEIAPCAAGVTTARTPCR